MQAPITLSPLFHLPMLSQVQGLSQAAPSQAKQIIKTIYLKDYFLCLKCFINLFIIIKIDYPVEWTTLWIDVMANKKYLLFLVLFFKY